MLSAVCILLYVQKHCFTELYWFKISSTEYSPGGFETSLNSRETMRLLHMIGNINGGKGIKKKSSENSTKKG